MPTIEPILPLLPEYIGPMPYWVFEMLMDIFGAWEFLGALPRGLLKVFFGL